MVKKQPFSKFLTTFRKFKIIQKRINIMIGLLETNEEKLQFLIKKYLKLSQKKLAKEFEVTEVEMSKIVNNQENKLKNVHLLGFCHLHDIPYEVFKNKRLNTEERVKSFLDDYKNDNKKEIFKRDTKLLKNLVGDWYAYFYPSNSFANIYSIKTTIKKDGSVIDENSNFGRVYLGTMQSMIIKEAYNSKNLISITFDNIQVAYGMFPFTLVSKRNHVNRKMCNFGFFANRKLDLNVAEKILGVVQEVQLKMNCDFGERISEYIEYSEFQK